MAVVSLPNFTRPARQRWESISANIRQRLLANVWCGQCRQAFDCGRQELNDWLQQVARQYQDKGLGELLLIDALTRARRITTEAGGIGLFVGALDAQAAEYYRHFGFDAAPDNPLLLFLPAKVAG